MALKVVRIWHGWTTRENADIYENLLKTEIFKSIEEKNVSGYKAIQLIKRPLPEKKEIEFTTIMWFSSWAAVKEFAGENYEHSYVPEKARKVLKRFDSLSQHYEVEDTRYY